MGAPSESRLPKNQAFPATTRSSLQRWRSSPASRNPYVKEAGEYAPGNFLDAMLTNRTSGPTNEDILWQIQCNIITDLAKKGPCVIVGRCADFILKDDPNVLKVFVHADMAFRSKRIVEVYGERAESPEQRLKDKDKRRGTYYRFYTGRKWGQMRAYDLALDSGVLGIEKCAELICTIFE